MTIIYLSGAAMSLKSIFSKPFKKHLEAYRHKMDWAMGSCSDCVAILNAYQVNILFSSLLVNKYNVVKLIYIKIV